MNSSESTPHAADTASGVGRGPRGTTYANFHDPVGLVLRMLRSGNRVARSALWRAAGELAARPADRLLGLLEARRLKRAGAQLPPMLLIVGLPRSGTTLVYQTLANCLRLSYFNNLSALFPRSVITVSAWWRRSFDPPQRGAGASSSYYGHTAGLSGVNEGLHVWNRWLGEDRTAAPRQFDPATGADMRRFFAAWSQAFPDRPLLNKSNRNAFCVEALAAALPTALFVVVRRDPIFVAQSLLKAREAVQGDVSIGWGAGAERPGRKAGDDALADVADQVLYCDGELSSQVARLTPERVIEVRYEDFCSDPRHLVLAVWDRVRAACPPAFELAAPQVDMLRPLPHSDRVSLPEGQFTRLRALLAAPGAGGVPPP